MQFRSFYYQSVQSVVFIINPLNPKEISESIRSIRSIRGFIIINPCLCEFVEVESLLDDIVVEQGAAFDSCHSLDESRPFVFCEPFLASEARELADVADVLLRVVFRRRCPSRDDVLYAYGLVFVSVSPQDAEGGAESIGQRYKLNKSLVCLRNELAFPDGPFHAPDVQRIVVSHSSCHGGYWLLVIVKCGSKSWIQSF